MDPMLGRALLLFTVGACLIAAGLLINPRPPAG
jgi:hypothetical protein